MQDEKIISGKNEDEIWAQIKTDLANPDILEYRVTIHQQKRKILLDINIDLGGGFEGGYATTTFRSQLKSVKKFRFAMHREGLLDEIGKFFGMQHVKTGAAEFDKKIIIKTNDEEKVKQVFKDRSAREVFKRLDKFTLEITEHHAGDSDKKFPFLELIIEEGITDVKLLRKIYHAFFTTLELIEIS